MNSKWTKKILAFVTIGPKGKKDIARGDSPWKQKQQKLAP